MPGQRGYARYWAGTIVASSACLLSFCFCLTAEVPTERESIAPVAMRSRFETLSGLSKSSRQAEAQKSYGRLPLCFEVNRGQFDNQANFRARGKGYSVFLTPGAAVFAFRPSASATAGSQDSGSEFVRMDLVDANPVPKITGLEKLPGKTNHFIGSDPEKWRTNIPTYARVRYSNVYPGIDLVYYGNQRQLEYDFIVKPGADPAAIRLAFSDAKGVQLDSNGDLVLKTASGEVRQRKPSVYQEIAGVRQEIAGGYRITNNRHVSFQTGSYDAAHPLVIDPVLVYTAVKGGSAVDEATDISVDSLGNAYVTGWTASNDFPTVNPAQPNNRGGRDAVVLKLNSSGTALVYSTYLGGSNEDEGSGIAVDSSGNVYVCGHTQSTNFPTRNALYPILRGTTDAFVTKLDATGSLLQYSTYFGGGGWDDATALTVDSGGNVYLTGNTSSVDFPTANPFQGTGGGMSGGVTALFKSTDAAASWTPSSTGLPNAHITALIIDPTNPSNLYVGTEGSGVYKSTNGGSTWISTNPGLTNLGIRALVIDPLTPSTLYAATFGGGMFKSTNSGGNWVQVNSGLSRLYPSAAVIDPINPSTLYAGAGAVFLPEPIIFKTTNGGSSWAVSLQTVASITCMAIHPVNPETIYAGTSYGQFSDPSIIRTTNAGGSWQIVHANSVFNAIRALAIDPGDPSTVYAGKDFNMFKSTNGGDTWSLLSNSPLGVRTLAVSPAGSLTVYAGNSSGIHKSMDAGTSWTAANSGLTNVDVTALAIQTSNPSTLYAGCKQPAPFAGDAFVTKINSSGSALVYSTYLGGAKLESGDGITIDASGNTYVTGVTYSTDFPTLNPFQSANAGGTNDVFVTKLGPTGSTAIYSTYLGGNQADDANDIAVDSSGNVYVTGSTYSTDFPTKNAIQGRSSLAQDGFLTKLSSTGSSLLYSTHLQSAWGLDVALDSSNNAFVTGYINGSTALIPMVNPLQPNTGTAFLAKLNPDGSSFFYSTRVGADYAYDISYAVAVDALGSAYVSGGYLYDLFVTKIDDPEPVFSLEMTQPNYTSGQTVMATNVRLRNPSAIQQSVEVKLWVDIPGISPIPLMNIGSDGSFSLPPGHDQSLGSLTLFAVASNTPSGNYELSSRMLHPGTGSLLSEDRNPFSVGGTAVLAPDRAAAADPPPRIDVTLSVTTIEVTATQFLISNPGTVPVAVELRVWLRGPDGVVFPVLNAGSDGSFALPAGLSKNLAPMSVMSINGSTPKGTYEFSSRIFDPVTGKQLSQDYNEFKIQ